MTLVWLASLALSWSQPADAPSTLKTDERVVLFPAVGWRDGDGSWRVEVRGWIFEPEKNDLLRRTSLRGLADALDLDEADADCDRFRARAAAFLVDCERDKRIRIVAENPAGDVVTLAPPSTPAGHFTATLALRAPIADTDKPTRLAVRVDLPASDPRRFETQALLIPFEGLSVVSDIDDTIKISEVRDRRKLLENTFVSEFRAAPGMADFYARLRERGAVFHYVSASPWQLYEPLSEFARAAGYPSGTFEMREFRVKDRSFLSLFDDPEEYKKSVIEPMLRRWPGRTFVLIGDSGEKDPEAYLALARRYPKQIERVYIRDVTGEDLASERYRRLTVDMPERLLVVFTDPSDLPSR